MLKLNKVNFKQHLNADLLKNKYLTVSASLKTVEHIHVALVNYFLAQECLKYIRINDYCIEASSHRKEGKYDLPMLSNYFIKKANILSCVYSIEREYISFDCIDLKTKNDTALFVNGIKKIVPDTWEIFEDYHQV